MDPIDLQELGQRSLSSIIEEDLIPDHAWFLTELEEQIERSAGLDPGVDDSSTLVQQSLHQALEQLRAHINSEELVVFPLILAGRGSEARESVRGLEDEHLDIAEQITVARKAVDERLGQGQGDPDWVALQESMIRFERRMKRHTAIEYSVLFPRMLCEEDESAGE